MSKYRGMPEGCPQCGGDQLMALVDVTVHVRLIRNSKGRLVFGAMEPNWGRSVRGDVNITDPTLDTDLVCHECGYTTKVADL